MLVISALVASLTLDWEHITRNALRSAGAVGGVVTLTVALRQARAPWARVRAVWARTVKIAQRERDRLQTAIDVEAAQVAELHRELQNLTTAGQLAGFVADRATAGSYRTRLGVMTQIREDFQHMAQLLVPHPNTALPRPPAPDGAPPGAPRGQDAGSGAEDVDDPGVDAADDTLPAIDRIVLYIDDLDRCPPHRVVEMLEAIHLLLAVRLFVVVVAVDPRWLLRAIAVHYRDMLHADTLPADTALSGLAVDPDDEELWRSTPAHYLEKIFQVVLTLPPLDSPGYQRLLTTLVNVRRDRSPNPTPAPSEEAVPATGAPAAAAREPRHANGEQDWAALLPARPGDPVPLPAPAIVDRVDPLALEPDELTLLELLGPPLLITTPRAVKRLANSYGLLTALRGDQHADDLNAHPGTVIDLDTKTCSISYHPYRAAIVLLGVLVAYPALGPALFLHLHHAAATAPHHPWSGFLTGLDPHWGKSGWRNAADPLVTPVQAQQWQALLKGIRAVADRAVEAGLPLPEPLHAWADWIIPVGRLSFPTGRIVSSLDRLQPLPETHPSRHQSTSNSDQQPPAPHTAHHR